MQNRNRNRKIRQVMRKLILFFQSQEKRASESEKEELWMRITEDIRQEKKMQLRRHLYKVAAIAASVGLLIAYYNVHVKKEHTPKTNIERIASSLHRPNPDKEKEIVLNVSGKEQIRLANNSRISHKNDGSVNVGSETIRKTTPLQEEDYNQLTVPKGRRSELQLSDGSKLWVNAGSRVVYPQQFSQTGREIYVEGEVYLEVSEDKTRPFIVRTSHFEVKVLGTCFNINAYESEEQSAVVLAEGAIQITGKEQKSFRLQPNQMARIGKHSQPEIVPVNAGDYTCWTQGILILHAESMASVCNKLSLYYGKEIQTEEEAKDLPLSGKLDLKEKLDDVIRLISHTAPISYSKINGIFVIDKRQ